MSLLVERARQNDIVTGLDVHPWLRTLPEQMIRAGDELIVDMAAIDAENARLGEQPKREKTPRSYRSSASLVEQRDRLVAKRDAVAGVKRHATDDLAAYAGIGVRQSSRQRRRYAASVDLALAGFVALDRRVRDLDARILRAKARERANLR